jgi:hypothetical protein
MGRVFLGALLAAVVLMAWGFGYWVYSPMAGDMLTPTPGGDSVPSALKEKIQDDGIYFYPRPKHFEGDNAHEAFQKKHQEGPLLEVVYVREGMDISNPLIYVLGFLHNYVTAFVAALLLSMALPGLPSYGSRVLFVFGLGVFAAVTVHLSNPIWRHHPWAFSLFSSGYVAGGWLLAGLVLALVIRPKAA